MEPIQRALSCFATGKVTVDRYEPGAEGILVLNRGASVRLNGAERIEIHVSMRYLVIMTDEVGKGPFKVTTTGWIYSLLSHDGDELLAYHWHPISDSHMTTPHMHLPAQKVHYPTGRVLIEDVLTASLDLGASPKDHGAWGTCVADNRAAFLRGATWGHPADPSSPDSN